jgi:S1-C subfamily serine protease
VPPLEPGDPGDGHGEDHIDGDDVGYVPPLPPEDRLWRHPSEVSAGRTAAPVAPVARRADRRTAWLMLLAGMAGATLAVGAVGALGGFDERIVERQVAVRSSVPGEEADHLESVASQTGPSVAALLVHRGDERDHASAVALRSDGYLVTDAHAIDGADEIDVVLHGGPAGTARIVGVDDATGIAVLHLDTDLEGAVLADDADVLRVGARTMAVGASPDGGWDLMVSTGIVSAVGRRLESAVATRHGMILLDTPIAPGTAGGALVDRAGVVVGILSGTEAVSRDMSFGVATPIGLARHVADQIIEHGRVTHVWLGLSGTDLEVDQALAKGLDGGALVEEVTPDGPAARAGIEPGDVVASIDGEPTHTMSALIAALRMHIPGDVVELGVHRAGAVRPVRVTLAPKG